MTKAIRSPNTERPQHPKAQNQPGCREKATSEFPIQPERETRFRPGSEIGIPNENAVLLHNRSLDIRYASERAIVDLRRVYGRILRETDLSFGRQ